MSECNTSSDYLQPQDAPHTRVAAWLRGIALIENETSDTASNPNTTSGVTSSLEDRWRSRAKRRLSGRSFPNYLGSVNDPFDLSMRHLSNNRGVSEVFQPPMHSPTSWPIACEPPAPTSTMSGPPSIYSLDGHDHETFLSYVEMDWDSEPVQGGPPGADNDDELKRRERRANVLTSTSIVPCCNDAAFFYAQHSTYNVPTDASAAEEDSPRFDSSWPKRALWAVAFYRLIKGLAHQLRSFTPSTINVTVNLRRAQVARCESTKERGEKPTWRSSVQVAMARIWFGDRDPPWLIANLDCFLLMSLSQTQRLEQFVSWISEPLQYFMDDTDRHSSPRKIL
ncbi:unnamed protein product [Cyclocybe aegerita]|uniref:Uncharacterized protein n=1 Tax=Cyclocybe aegerita TaxID=1973307 RepID=A0A8S0W9L0_CYCAE|nr:unnamed protein product [Cyclocybe aegerita]